MNASVVSLSATLPYVPGMWDKLLDHLEYAGYEPLLRRSKDGLCHVFGSSLKAAEKHVSDEFEDDYGIEQVGKGLASLEGLGYSWGPSGSKIFPNVREIKGEV